MSNANGKVEPIVIAHSGSLTILAELDPATTVPVVCEFLTFALTRVLPKPMPPCGRLDKSTTQTCPLEVVAPKITL